MKEQNNIEGTVDKTSLKCKGICIFLFSIFFLFHHCGTSAIKAPVTLHPFLISPSPRHLFVLLSPPGSLLLCATAGLISSSLQPSIHQTHL